MIYIFSQHVRNIAIVMYNQYKIMSEVVYTPFTMRSWKPRKHISVWAGHVSGLDGHMRCTAQCWGWRGGGGARPSPTAFRSQSFRPLLVPASRGRRPVPTQAGGPAACSEPVLPPGPAGPWRLIRMRTDTLLSTAMAGTRRHTRSGTPREAMSACFLFTSIWK